MAFQRLRETFQSFFGRGTFPHQLAFLLEIPLRRLILSPEELADRLELTPTSRVLEIGPGPGYFSVEIARRIPGGHLELFDLQPEMLDKARRKFERAGVRNVGFTPGDAGALPFKENDFDVVFMVAVLGEIPDPSGCLRGAYRTLRPGGLLSITEQPGDPDFTPLESLIALAEPHGFQYVKCFGKGKNYTANFRRPTDG